MANPDHLVARAELDTTLASFTASKQGYTAADHSLAAWTGDPSTAGSTQLLGTAGTIIGSRIYVPAGSPVGGIWLNVATAGATLTAGQCFAALWDSTGALLDTSVDQATNWASTGLKLASFSAATSRAAGFYDVGVWYQGTTAPTISRASTTALMNIKLSGQALRCWTANTGVTTAAPATLGTKTASSIPFWFGLNPT